MDGTVQSVEDQRARDFVRGQVDLYAKDHPDWQSYGHDDRFDPWLATQPNHIREAAARNSQYIVDAGEASDVLARFKADHGIGVTAPPAPAADPPPGGKGPQRDERRDRQRDGGRASEVRGGPATTSTDPEDPEALWDSIATKRYRQRPQR